MGYVLGVDLGTTYTAAATWDPADGAARMLGLGNRALQIPSVLYRQPDGTFLVGEPAERRGTSDPANVVREFKRRIGDHVPIVIGTIPYSPQALTAGSCVGWWTWPPSDGCAAGFDHVDPPRKLAQFQDRPADAGRCSCRRRERDHLQRAGGRGPSVRGREYGPRRRPDLRLRPRRRNLRCCRSAQHLQRLPDDRHPGRNRAPRWHRLRRSDLPTGAGRSARGFPRAGFAPRRTGRAGSAAAGLHRRERGPVHRRRHRADVGRRPVSDDRPTHQVRVRGHDSAGTTGDHRVHLPGAAFRERQPGRADHLCPGRRVVADPAGHRNAHLNVPPSRRPQHPPETRHRPRRFAGQPQPVGDRSDADAADLGPGICTPSGPASAGR